MLENYELDAAKSLLPMKSYQLHIHLSEATAIKIGKLGVFLFPQGSYIYTGSAKKNMDARIQRHLRKQKKLKWHIDYLTSHPNVKITRVNLFDEDECLLNQRTSGQILIPRFGASDCKHDCESHLKYLGVNNPQKGLIGTNLAY